MNAPLYLYILGSESCNFEPLLNSHPEENPEDFSNSLDQTLDSLTKSEKTFDHLSILNWILAKFGTKESSSIFTKSKTQGDQILTQSKGYDYVLTY